MGHPYGHAVQHPHAHGMPGAQQWGPQAQRPQAPPPPRKSRVGLVVALLVGAFVVLGGAVVLALVLLSTGLSDDEDQSKVLKEHVQRLMTATQTGDPKQVEGPLINLGILPDHARPWFVETYGPVLGKRLYESWETDVFEDLPDMLRPVVEAKSRGRTQTKITRLTTAASASESADKGVLRNQKKPRALYIVEFVTPGGTTATKDLYYFAIVNGRFGYVGQMVAAR
ncbi:MAG: hypothetical protein WKG00_05205 [Polyangiaceae bacterium]